MTSAKTLFRGDLFSVGKFIYRPALVGLATLLMSCSEKQPAAEEATVQLQAQLAPRAVVRQRQVRPEQAGETFPVEPNVQSKLPIYEIQMKPEDLEMMDSDPRGEELYPATFRANGVVYENVKIRYRGQWARTWPKKPLKIFFNEEKLFEGQKRLNLNSSFRDPSFIRESVAYHIYRKAGVPASQSQLARVHLNGEFRGLYVQVEQPDKAFAKRNDLKGATIIKANSKMKEADERVFPSVDHYRMHYEQETQKDEDAIPVLKAFCEELERTPNVLEFFEKHVDLEQFVNYLAASALCQNWDGYNKNHFLVYDAGDSKKWFVLPWDLDRAMGDHWDWSFGRADLPIQLGTEAMPGVTGWNRMIDRFFSHPELGARLAARLEELLAKEFTSEKLDPVIDAMQASIAPEAALDYRRWPNPGSPWWRDDKAGLEKSVKTVKQFIRDRRAFLLAELPKLRQGAGGQGKARASFE
jgi:spore coat protein H